MDRDEILNMPAGREMDALVAEKVMGWHIETDDSGWGHWADANGHWGAGINQDDTDDYEDDEDFHILHWHPSQSIKWAWEVVEQVTKKSKFTVIEIRGGNELYQIAFWYPLKDSWHAEGLLPLAICRAALLTVCE